MKKNEARTLQAIIRKAITDLARAQKRIEADAEAHAKYCEEHNLGMWDGFEDTAYEMTENLTQAVDAATLALDFFDGYPDSWYWTFEDSDGDVLYGSFCPAGYSELKEKQKALIDEIATLKNRALIKEKELADANRLIKKLDDEWRRAQAEHDKEAASHAEK